MTKRILALLLALVMLLALAACNNTTGPADTGDGKDTQPDETTFEALDVHTGDEHYDVTEYLPAETFDGDEIYVWVDATTTLNWGIPEDRFIQGDIIHEAVIKRNQAVEDQFDVVLTYDQQYPGNWRNQGTLRQSVLAGDEYDILEGVALYQNKQLLYGIFVDLTDNEYIDLSMPWWFQKTNPALIILGRQYVASGYYDFPTVTRSTVVFYNSPLAMDFRIGNMYEVVKNGEWTWEKMLELVELVGDDVNQDGVYDTQDRYGAAGRYDSWINIASTTGYQFVVEDGEGGYELTGVTEDLLKISEKVYPLLYNNTNYYLSYNPKLESSWPSAKIAKSKEMFTNGQVLFLFESLGTVQEAVLRDFGEYGILPVPLVLESQTDYASPTSPFVSSICSTTGSLRETSIILEALQMESYNILRPAYVTEALSYKYLTDPQAVEMLNFIFSTVTTDWAINLSNSALASNIPGMITREEYIYSYFAKEKGVFQERLDDFLDSFEGIPEFAGNP